MDWVVRIGLIELAVGALLGWALVIQHEKPEWLPKAGIRNPGRRILQTHLDYILMGLILIAVGSVVGDLPTILAVALVFGTIVNPFLFVPPMFNPDAEKATWYRALSIVSFLGVSLSLVAAAIVGPG